MQPIYADYSFGNIANTIEFLLTGEPRAGRCCRRTASAGATRSPRKVVLFFVDSFGWEFWQEHGDRFRTTAPRRGTAR